jgi:hypothetical protein
MGGRGGGREGRTATSKHGEFFSVFFLLDKKKDATWKPRARAICSHSATPTEKLSGSVCSTLIRSFPGKKEKKIKNGKNIKGLCAQSNFEQKLPGGKKMKRETNKNVKGLCAQL